jgi:hypothetical protein
VLFCKQLENHMDRETALTKIKKCLALAKSSNEHEAAAAMRQAQKLPTSPASPRPAR